MPTVVISPFILLLPLAALAWYSRRWALLVLLASLSAYIIRGSVFGLPTTWLELGIYLTLVVWLVKGDWRVWQEIKLSALQGWLVPLALWLAASVVGILVAGDLRLALGVWKGFIIDPLILSLMVATVALADKSGTTWWRNVIAALLVGATATTLVAFLQSWLLQADRLQSGYDSPNVLAMYLSPILVASVLWYLSQRGRASLTLGWRVLWLAGCMVTAAGVFLTNSYTALVAVAGAWLVALLVHQRPKLAIAAGAAIVLAGLLGPLVAVSLNYSFFKGHTNVTYGTTSAEVRLTMWRQAVVEISARPVFGLGLGQWQPTFLAMAREQGLLSIRQPGLAIELYHSSLYPHNLWLTTWLATGGLGLIALIWLALKVFQTARRTDALMPAAVLTVQMLHGALDTPFWKNDLAVLWWLAVAAAIIWQQRTQLQTEHTL